MASLIVDLGEGEAVSVGGAVVKLLWKAGRKARLRLEAPQDLKIEIMKAEKTAD